VALLIAAGMGLFWVVTLDPAQFPGGLPFDVGRALGYAIILGAPGALVALLWRNERFALWRGLALTLALAGGHAGLLGLVLAADRELAYPGVPKVIFPTLTLIYGLAVVFAGRKRFLNKPSGGPVILAVGLGLLVSAAWVIVGVLGTLPELAQAILEALGAGLLSAVLVATLFFYDDETPANHPFWSAVLIGVTFAALENGLLAVRGYWTQGMFLSQAVAFTGYVAGVLLMLGEKPDPRRSWWAAWAFFSVAFLLPFAWTEGFEGDWMFDEMAPAWFPGMIAGLASGLVLGGLALLARKGLARLTARGIVPGVFSLGALALVAGLYVGFGQPGLQPETFFVVMADQADTGFALDIAGREERYAAVFETLTEHALDDQADLRAFLDGRGVSYTPYYLINGMEVEGGFLLRRQIAARPDVARILNSPHTRPLRPSINRLGLYTPTSHTSANLAWGVDEMDAELVWEEFGVTGEGIIVGGADSGVDWTHPALEGSYIGSEGSHDYTWLDPWDDTQEPTDTNGHGTHTMGTVLGQDGIGVAPGARWIACRNLGRNLGNPAYYLDCMQFLFAPHPQDGDPFTEGDPARGAHVTNNSWGCPPEEGCDGVTMAIGVEHLYNAGQMFVVSAGNEGPECSTIGPPANAETAFSVGAASPSRTVTFFSSRGPVLVDGSGRVKPDVVAPGLGIPSSLPDDGIPGVDYGLSDGTSMAGPHVTGVVALLWSAEPDLIGDIDGTAAAMTGTAQRDTAPDLCGATDGDQNNTYGFGFVDARGAVDMALEAE
jgi:subtilisin family serine protease